MKTLEIKHGIFSYKSKSSKLTARIRHSKRERQIVLVSVNHKQTNKDNKEKGDIHQLIVCIKKKTFCDTYRIFYNDTIKR